MYILMYVAVLHNILTIQIMKIYHSSFFFLAWSHLLYQTSVPELKVKTQV